MGCCNESSHKGTPEIHKQKLKECILTGNVKQFCCLIAGLKQLLKSSYNIDSVTLSIENDQEINIVGYCLLKGKTAIFQYVHQVLKANLSIMEDFFEKLGVTGLLLICENNYIDLFSYYVPIYLIIKRNPQPTRKRKYRETIEFSEKYDRILETLDKTDERCYTPIQMACYYGHISMVKCALNYTSTLQSVPIDLDINYISENIGDNCALIACRTGNYSMIKFLHTSCQADFFVLNNNKENCIQVLTASTKTKHMCEFYQCLTYLIEKIGIDISYNYQETLIMMDYPKACNYFIEQLGKLNIFVNKEEIEKECISKNTNLKSSATYETGENFTLGKMFPDLREENESSISVSITSSDVSASSIFLD